MTYNEFIQNIISTRGQWNIPNGDYYEKHHIIPLCLGGCGDSLDGKKFKRNSKHENCIWLYPDEHFIAHKLLAKENPDNSKLAYAYFIMAAKVQSSTNPRYYDVSPEDYKLAKELISLSYKANPRSEEFKKNVSDGMKRQRAEVGFSEEHLKNISKSLKARKDRLHSMGLTQYGTPLRKNGECGKCQQYATTSVRVGCAYNGARHEFNSIREACIWWFNTCKPFGENYVECTLQRKIKLMCKGEIVTWGQGKNGGGKKNRKVLNEEISWFYLDKDMNGGDNNEKVNNNKNVL